MATDAATSSKLSDRALELVYEARAASQAAHFAVKHAEAVRIAKLVM